MLIGLDFDGVIVDHSEHKLQLARELGYELEPWQTNTNIMKKFVSESEYRGIQEKIYTELSLVAPPIAEALEHIRQLGGEPLILSARRSDTVQHALQWMKQHDLFEVIPVERVHFCAKSSQKGDYCRRLGVEVFLDDKLAVLDVLDSNVKKFLFDHHDSVRQSGLAHPHQVISGWAEFVNTLERVRA
ncbi:MAG: hypothetical protein V1738_02865 [Patescibacteria group bacterium]